MKNYRVIKTRMTISVSTLDTSVASYEKSGH